MGQEKQQYSGVENSNYVVIIPAHNEIQHIKKTIDSVQTQSISPQRIIVIDDFSDDGTGDFARKCGVEVIRTPNCTGTKARAQDYALSLLKEEDDMVVVTLDADTILDQRAVENVLPYLRDPKVASVCGFVIPQRIKTLWEKARFIQYLYYIWLNKGAQDHWGVPLVSSGCFSAFNIKHLKGFGGFPVSTMAEDMDLTWRFLTAGLKIRLAPKALCYPMDPHNYQLYRSQVERWYRSFLQNITLHKWRLFKNKRLVFFIGWYLISGLITPIYWVLIPLIFLRIPFTDSLSILAIFFLSTGFLMVSGISLFKGWQLHKFWLTLKSLPCYWIVSPVEIYLFLKSVWLEWILKKHLVNWEKGH